VAQILLSQTDGRTDGENSSAARFPAASHAKITTNHLLNIWLRVISSKIAGQSGI